MSQKDRTQSTPAAGSAVLLVGDDREVGGIWSFALRQMGLQPVLAHSATEALSLWERQAYDLVLIDVSGPRLDGIGLARRLRAEAVNPILLFTPDREETQVLQAYQAGVDECVLKPVSPAMFLAKVRAWLRRTWTVPTAGLEPIEKGPLRLDPASRQVTVEGGNPIRLTNLEFRLLHLLMSQPGQVLGPELIIGRVWGYCGEGDTALLKSLVYRLRQKIEPDPAHPAHIQTAGPGNRYVFY
jgi:DNA-binding response OmpR family regulator